MIRSKKRNYNPNEAKKRLVEAMNFYREITRLNQTEFGNLVGYSQQLISNLYSKPFSLDRALPVAQEFNLDLNYIVFGENPSSFDTFKREVVEIGKRNLESKLKR